MGGQGQPAVDEDLLETGINSHIPRLISNEFSSDVARSRVMRYFQANFSPSAQRLMSTVPTNSHSLSYKSNWVEGAEVTAMEVIMETVSRICQAPEDQLPRRETGGFKKGNDKFFAPTLTGVDNKKFLKCRDVGAPGYALFLSKDPADVFYMAPDKLPKEFGCVSLGDCCGGYGETSSDMGCDTLKSERAPLQQLVCAHKVCTTCAPNADRTSMCRHCSFNLYNRAIHLGNAHIGTLQKKLYQGDIDTKLDDDDDVGDDDNDGDDDDDGDIATPATHETELSSRRAAVLDKLKRLCTTRSSPTQPPTSIVERESTDHRSEVLHDTLKRRAENSCFCPISENNKEAHLADCPESNSGKRPSINT